VFSCAWLVHSSYLILTPHLSSNFSILHTILGSTSPRSALNGLLHLLGPIVAGRGKHRIHSCDGEQRHGWHDAAPGNYARRLSEKERLLKVTFAVCLLSAFLPLFYFSIPPENLRTLKTYVQKVAWLNTLMGFTCYICLYLYFRLLSLQISCEGQQAWLAKEAGTSAHASSQEGRSQCSATAAAYDLCLHWSAGKECNLKRKTNVYHVSYCLV